MANVTTTYHIIRLDSAQPEYIKRHAPAISTTNDIESAERMSLEDAIFLGLTLGLAGVRHTIIRRSN